jgi:hypothetical protein
LPPLRKGKASHCGVMIGRGIDQILPYPGDPAIDESERIDRNRWRTYC